MNRTFRTLLAAILLLSTAAACNLPRATATPGIEFPTPNLTMTAIFSPGGILGTPTPMQVTPISETPQSGGGQLPTQQPTVAPTTGNGGQSSPQPLPATSTPTGGDRTASFKATYLSTPPVIDGVWDEWTNQAYPARSVVYGGGNLVDSKDLEGSFRVGWDNNNLYIAVKVIDDKYVQNATGSNLYMGDSLEIQFDSNLQGDISLTSLDADDYQLGISPGNPDTSGTKEAYLWNPPSAAGSKPQVQIASVGGDGLYRVEAAIPWSLFNVTPQDNQQFGFSLNISDNDNPSQNVQQTMISAVPGRQLTDPTSWGLLTLSR